MNVRLVLGYVAVCAALSASDLRGFAGLWCYALGLVVCLLIEPAHQWMAARRAYAEGLKQFEQDAQVARSLASQIHLGGNL